MASEESHRPDWLGLLGFALLLTAVGLVLAGGIALRSLSGPAPGGTPDDGVTATTDLPPSTALGPGGKVIVLDGKAATSAGPPQPARNPRQGATILFVAAGVAGAAGSLLVARRARAKAT